MRAPLVLLLPLALLSGAPALAFDPAPVPGRQGMVVSAQHLASEAGLDVLKKGGNAVDAAVAVGYALAVTYPAAGNLGGGGFMTVRLADGTTGFLDFREKAPAAATPGMFLAEDGSVAKGRSTDTWLSVGVPGTASGLEAARAKWGRMPRQALLGPAIRLARDGFVVEPQDVAMFRDDAPKLARDPEAAAIFLRDGNPPEVGARLVQPDLAGSLELLAQDGPDAFYRGSIGQAIVQASQEGGGILQEPDFAGYKVRHLAPIECDYRGFHIISAPPPSSGGVVLCEVLGVLEGFDLRALGFHSAAAVHLMTEALRQAFHDRNSRLGDPDFVDNPVAELLDHGYLAQVRSRIDPEHATPSAQVAPLPQEGSNTTHYSVVDGAGNAVSVTYTLNGWFGAKRVAPGTGILLNNEMDDFTAKPGSPNMFGLVQGAANAVAPGKTPLSSMTPTILEHNGKVAMVVGSPGGPQIITTVLNAILNMVDYGMTVQEAVDAPRIHHQWLPDVIVAERFALSADTRDRLQAMGHKIVETAPFGIAAAITIGGPRLTGAPGGDSGQGLVLATPDVGNATLFGVADPRGTGSAEGY